LEKRSTCRELGCFFEVGDKDGLKGDVLVDKTAGDVFALFWKVIQQRKLYLTSRSEIQESLFPPALHGGIHQ